MTSSRSAKSPPRLSLAPRVKVWLEIDGEYVFGHGICQILEAVAAAGSIKEAAAKLDKSYRYVWGRIKKAEKAMARELVTAHVGGSGVQRSELTPLATELCLKFNRLREKMIRQMAKDFEAAFPVAD